MLFALDGEAIEEARSLGAFNNVESTQKDAATLARDGASASEIDYSSSGILLVLEAWGFRVKIKTTMTKRSATLAAG